MDINLSEGKLSQGPRRKIVAITGTYRKGGTIDQAVEEILLAARDSGAETKKIYLLDKKINFCTNCRLCTQQPGPDFANCIHQDDQREIVKELENADIVILASPMNFGQVTALMKRFIERLLPYAFWPWGTMIPKLRRKTKTRKAVLVTSSTMPSWLGRLLTGIFRSMRETADTIGAKVVAKLYIGLVGLSPNQHLPPHVIRRAQAIGRQIAR